MHISHLYSNLENLNLQFGYTLFTPPTIIERNDSKCLILTKEWLWCWCLLMISLHEVPANLIQGVASYYKNLSLLLQYSVVLFQWLYQRTPIFLNVRKKKREILQTWIFGCWHNNGYLSFTKSWNNPLNCLWYSTGQKNKSKVGNLCRGWSEGSLFDSSYTKVQERALLLSLDCSTLPLIPIL